MSEADFLPSSKALEAVVPRAVLATMWTRVAERLRAGEVLITPDDFQDALTQEYGVLTGGELAGDGKAYIRQMVELVNARYPETYVTQGVQNGMYKAFGEGVRTLKWTEAHVQARGAKSLRTFSRRERIRDLLHEVNVQPDQIDVLQIVKGSLDELRSESQGRETAVGASEILDADFGRSPTLAAPAVSTPRAESEAAAAEAQVQEAIAAGEVEASEARQRTERTERRAGQLRDLEMEKVPQHLDSLVQRAEITQAQADQFRQVRQVDDRVAKGEIGEAEGSRIRNSLMDGAAREKVESKVRESIEQSSRYLHVFDSLRKIAPAADGALAFLIRHKGTVVAAQLQPEEVAAVHRELTADAALLKDLIDIMERKDQEVRMVSVRLPPYNYVLKRGVEKIGNLTIEESFLEELRHLDLDEISERLCSAVSQVRIRPAADIRCFVSLVDHVIKRTPFRKEIRLLRIGQTIQEFFDSTSDLAEARHQAENFLHKRMRRLFPDLSADETADIRRRGAEMIDQIEQTVLSKRRAEVEEKRRQTEAARPQQRSEAGGDDEMELTEEEKQLGVQIGRVEVRVAGNLRKIPRKIMPDPDDPSKFAIAVRDPETGATVPEERRGSRRYIERGRDNIWRVV